MNTLFLIAQYFFMGLGVIFFLIILVLAFAAVKYVFFTEKYRKHSLSWLWCKHVHKQIEAVREHYMSPYDVGNGYKYYFVCQKCQNKWESSEARKEYDQKN